MTPLDRSRRSFLKTSVALAATLAHRRSAPGAIGTKPAGPLIAYVGTFSSPLRDVLPTQVDLPPGNGRGIHLFRVDRDDRGDDARPAFTRWERARAAWS